MYQPTFDSPIIKNNSITMSNGNDFVFNNPDSADYSIEVIAQSLSKICRFGGHCNEFYSVAQHSVSVSDLVPDELKMEALLHDAAEAFVGDMPTPLKQMLPEYKAIELEIEKSIRQKYGLPEEMNPLIKEADIKMFVTECRDLMESSCALKSFTDIEPDEKTILTLTPIQSYYYFMARYRNLSISCPNP